jgi:predicted choloylglycine hydrolase
VLRYILEYRDTVREACEVLNRVPSHMAYNVTLVDAAGDYATVYVSPDRPATITRRAVATNHQNYVEWSQFAHATATVDRERYLMARVRDPKETNERLAERFQLPPLYASNYTQGWGTLYTAIYRNSPCEAEFRWPGISLPQTFKTFRELYLPITYQQTVPNAI